MFLFFHFQILELLPILDSACSQKARFLICASIFPLCSPDVPRPVAACKSLCESVKADCSADPVLAAIWPKFIDCTVLPEPNNQELCMEVPQDELKFQTNHTVMAKNSSSASILHQTLLLRPPHVARNSGGGGSGPAWPWRSWTDRNVQRPPLISHTICPNNYTAIEGRCGPQCGRDAMFTDEQKKIADTCTLALSAICFILTLFTLVTFWAEPLRFGYPERPVLFMALCYNLLSVSYLERVIFHNPNASAAAAAAGSQLQACGTTPPCLASFIITSYLTLAAGSWWLIFSMCWYLSTVKQWSSEALDKRASLFHLIAWLPPIMPSVAAVLWGTVQPHELTGMCSAYGFVEVAGLVLLCVGASFALLAVRSLRSICHTVNDSSFHRRLAQVRMRILIFGCVFFTPSVVAVVLGFWEDIYATVPACVFGDPCVAPKNYSTIPTLLRLFFSLTGGSLAGIWVWSKKTCESYRSRIGVTGAGGVGGGGGGGGGSGIVGGIAGVNGISTKAASSAAHVLMQKKAKSIGPLYAGINFQNVPIYSYNNNTTTGSATGSSV